MREITKEMINSYRLKKLGYDFMGYPFDKTSELAFHHLIIPRRLSKSKGIGEGYLWWNGVILKQSTSHEYLHLIENKEYDMFLYITSELIDENIKGYIDKENLLKIREVLLEFESLHMNDINKRGNFQIKDEYLYRPTLEDEPVMKRVKKYEQRNKNNRN